MALASPCSTDGFIVENEFFLSNEFVVENEFFLDNELFNEFIVENGFFLDNELTVDNESISGDAYIMNQDLQPLEYPKIMYIQKGRMLFIAFHNKRVQ